MPISGKVGRDLIDETPFSLLALTRHEIHPQEASWFARCRSDYLRSLPVFLLEMLRVEMLLCLAWPALTGPFLAFSLFGCGLVMITLQAIKRRESDPAHDEIEVLRNRAGMFEIRALWWSVALCWGLIIAPHGNHEALIALGIGMIAVDGLSTMTLPHHALASSMASALAMTLGMFLRDGAAAAPVAIAAFTMAAFMHWSIYNLYYMFATRRIRTRRLRESNETVQLLLNQYDDEGRDWLYQIDSAGRIVNPSPRFQSACGVTGDELSGRLFTGLFEDCPELHQLRDALENGRPFRSIVVQRRSGGREHWWSISGRPVERLFGEEKGWRGFVADVSAARQAEARVAFMAHYDLLTQLPNRTLFHATMDRAFARRSAEASLGLVYIDLDHFKPINDGLGHAAGDAVLVEVARRLEATTRPADMVARLGGDEFVIMLAELPDMESGTAVVQRILDTLEEPIEVEGQVLQVGASIGLAFAPEHADCREELIRAADLAMYAVKSRGRRGMAVFDFAMEEEARERRALETELRSAMVREEFELYYQPLLDVETGITAGYEALLRWRHPQRGMIPPATFIPIAEETGLIVEIGAWVIRNALAEAARWPGHLTFAVNLSPAQMRDESLVAIILNALGSSGVSPQRLELEITENVLMQDSDDIIALLHRLRSLGIRIALDDFGTGYSSLNYLRSFPFDKIKIDRCFVNEMTDREDCQAIVRSVIALASDLKITTTAEGVEDIAQLQALRLGGCAQVQGYLFSQAVPASELDFGEQARPARPAGKPGKVVKLSRKKARTVRPKGERKAPARKSGTRG